MKIVEKYFLVDYEGNETELKCQLTSIPSHYDGIFSESRKELLKIRDNEIQEEYKSYLYSNLDML